MERQNTPCGPLYTRTFITSVRSAASALLLTFGLGISFVYGTMTRLEDAWSWKIVDVILGLIVAMGFCLSARAYHRGRRSAVLLAMLIWVGVSGSLLSLHQLPWYIRTTLARQSWTRSRISRVHEALCEFARDCGSFPTEEQGLQALLNPSESKNWKGPYVDDERHLRDAWDADFEYSLHDDKPLVWSCGRDGVSRTKDDIMVIGVPFACFRKAMQNGRTL